MFLQITISDKETQTRYFYSILVTFCNTSTQIDILSQKEKPIYCNLIEQDSGIVTAGNILGNQKNVDPNEIQTNMMKPVHDVVKVRSLVERAVEEYNKTHPRIKLTLYRVGIVAIITVKDGPLRSTIGT